MEATRATRRISLIGNQLVSSNGYGKRRREEEGIEGWTRTGRRSRRRRGMRRRGGTLVGERENEGEPGLEMKKKPMNVD